MPKAISCWAAITADALDCKIKVKSLLCKHSVIGVLLVKIKYLEQSAQSAISNDQLKAEGSNHLLKSLHEQIFNGTSENITNVNHIFIETLPKYNG